MPSAPPSADHSHQSSRLFAILISVAVLLWLTRLPLIAMPSLWIDEAFSLYHARLMLAQLWGEGWRLESSPPLYYSALWAWIRVVSDSELSSRLFSLLLTGLAAIFVYRATRGLAGPIAGAVALLAWLLPALGLEFSLEIRPYALQQCWIAIAISAFVNALTAWRSERTYGVAAVLQLLWPMVLAAVAAFYTHTTSIVFITSLAVAGLYFGWAARAGKQYFLVWFATCCVVALLCLPQVMAASGVLATNRLGLAWIPSSFSPIVLSRLVREIMLGSHYWGLTYAWPMVALIVASLVFSAYRVRRQAAVMSIGVVMAVTGATFLVLAALVQPILLSRTALWLWIPLAILLGCAAVTLQWQSPAIRIASAAWVTICLFTSWDYVNGRAEQRPWSNSIVDIAQRARAGDRILVIDPEVACLLDHYAQGALRSLPRLRLELGPGQRFRSRQRLDLLCNRLAPIEVAQVAPAGDSGDWILTDGPWQRGDLADLLDRARDTLRVTDMILGAGQVQATRVVRAESPQR